MDPATLTSLRHPTLDRRSFIAWPGYRSSLAIDMLDRRVIGTIAKPLAHASADYDQITDALAAGMGVMLPGEAWRNQLPRDHPKRRSQGFADQKFHRPAIVLRPDDRPLGAGFAEAYAEDHLEAELNARATLSTTPAHVLERECDTGRANDLLLAQLSSEAFAAGGRALPAKDRPPTEMRELYATIIVQGEHAKVPEIIDRIIGMYAEAWAKGLLASVTGFRVVAANCSQARIQVMGYATLALGLQQFTGLPAIVSGVGDTHLAFLASGVAATCAGLHGMTFKFPPDRLPEKSDDPEEEDPGIGVFTYHPAVLGNVGQLGDDGEPKRIALFANRPCHCGHHEPTRPPHGKVAIVRHNAHAVSADALEFTSGEVRETEQRIARRAGVATRERTFLQMIELKTGFLGVAVAAEALRGRADAAAGESD